MKYPLISIVIPVCDVEEYVDECLQSIVDQTYKNLEIIVVDDGSKDSSSEKCKNWKEKDKRIRVIRKEHGGPSDARNAGLKEITGEYVGFVDSDDVLHREMYERLYEMLSDTNAEISCCNMKRDKTFEHFKNEKSKKENIRIYNPQDAQEAIMKETDIFVTVWNKLYKREVIEGIVFEKGKIHEDEFWSYRAVAKAKKVVTTKERLYGYRQRKNSIMHRRYSLANLDFLDARAERLAFYEKNFPKLVSFARSNLRFECIRAMQYSLLCLAEKDKVVAKKRILEMVSTHPLKYADYRDLPIGRQAWCLCSNISFMGTCVIRNVFHYGP